MKNETARREIESLDYYLQNHTDDYSEESHTAMMMAIKALEQEPKTGYWIFVDKAHEHAHCSECDYGNVDLLDGRPHNYCPNCGCRMIDPQERSEVTG